MLAVVLLAVIGFGAYRLVSTHDAHNSATPAATIRPVATAKPKVTTKPITHKAAVPKGEAVITLTATSDCWVGFDSPTGQQLSEGTVPAGPNHDVDEKHPVSMVIGNPPGVKLTVNGKPQQMSTVNVVTLNINPVKQDPGHGRLARPGGRRRSARSRTLCSCLIPVP